MPPPSKRRKISGVEEVTFDFSAREEYLTGFHKRKLQRAKHAQEDAAKKERALKIEQRKELREQRKQELETHVQTVNDLLKKAAHEIGDAESDVESGATDDVVEEIPDIEADGNGGDGAHEEEYVDEDKFTTVTVEPMNLSESEEDSASEQRANAEDDTKLEQKTVSKIKKPQINRDKDGKRVWTKQKPDTAKIKVKKKKFRYESKLDRKSNRSKLAAKNSAAAKARRGD